MINFTTHWISINKQCLYTTTQNRKFTFFPPQTTTVSNHLNQILKTQHSIHKIFPRKQFSKPQLIRGWKYNTRREYSRDAKDVEEQAASYICQMCGRKLLINLNRDFKTYQSQLRESKSAWKDLNEIGGEDFHEQIERLKGWFLMKRIMRRGD